MKFSEGQRLAEDPLNGCTVVRGHVRHVWLQPSHLGKIKSGVKEIIEKSMGKYNDRLDAIPLAFSNIKIVPRRAVLLYDDVDMHFDVHYDVVTFRVVHGSSIKCKVNEVAADHLSCLVHNMINLAVPLPAIDFDLHNPKGLEVVCKVKNVEYKMGIIVVSGELTSESIQMLREIYVEETANYTVASPSSDSSKSSESSQDGGEQRKSKEGNEVQGDRNSLDDSRELSSGQPSRKVDASLGDSPAIPEAMKRKHRKKGQELAAEMNTALSSNSLRDGNEQKGAKEGRKDSRGDEKTTKMKHRKRGHEEAGERNVASSKESLVVGMSSVSVEERRRKAKDKMKDVSYRESDVPSDPQHLGSDSDFVLPSDGGSLSSDDKSKKRKSENLAGLVSNRMKTANAVDTHATGENILGEVSSSSELSDKAFEFDPLRLSDSESETARMDHRSVAEVFSNGANQQREAGGNVLAIDTQPLEDGSGENLTEKSKTGRKKKKKMKSSLEGVHGQGEVGTSNNVEQRVKGQHGSEVEPASTGRKRKRNEDLGMVRDKPFGSPISPFQFEKDLVTSTAKKRKKRNSSSGLEATWGDSVINSSQEFEVAPELGYTTVREKNRKDEGLVMEELGKGMAKNKRKKKSEHRSKKGAKVSEEMGKRSEHPKEGAAMGVAVPERVSDLSFSHSELDIPSIPGDLGSFPEGDTGGTGRESTGYSGSGESPHGERKISKEGRATEDVNSIWYGLSQSTIDKLKHKEKKKKKRRLKEKNKEHLKEPSSVGEPDKDPSSGVVEGNAADVVQSTSSELSKGFTEPTKKSPKRKHSKSVKSGPSHAVHETAGALEENLSFVIPSPAELEALTKKKKKKKRKRTASEASDKTNDSGIHVSKDGESVSSHKSDGSGVW